MFSSYSEIRRLRKRVVALEGELKQERERHLAREDALLDRCLTGANKHGLSERTVEPKKPVKPVLEVRPLSAEDEATLVWYKRCAEGSGLPESKAEEWFQAYLRGEEPVMGMEN
jgi:hypothetical protein